MGLLRFVLALLVVVVFAGGVAWNPAAAKAIFLGNYCAGLVGILFGCCSCYVFGGPVSDWLCKCWQGNIVGPSDTPSYSEQGGKMGRLERNMFVLAVFYPALGLVTAVIILKAFYVWWEKDKDQEFKQFHLWAGGNLISLLTGLFFGFLGQYVSLLVTELLK